MTLDAEVEPLGEAAEQCVDLAALESNHAAARATNEMVLVARLGNHIAVFAFRTMNQAEPLPAVQQLERTIHRGAPDLRIVALQLGDQFFGRKWHVIAQNIV